MPSSHETPDSILLRLAKHVDKLSRTIDNLRTEIVANQSNIQILADRADGQDRILAISEKYHKEHREALRILVDEVQRLGAD